MPELATLKEKLCSAASESGASATLDRVAAAAAPCHAFLRSSWFGAAANGAPVHTLVGRGATGQAIAAIPVIAKRVGMFALKEVPGSYWPFRSFPIDERSSDEELAAMLASPIARSSLGPAWRVGPIYADDPTGARLATIAVQSGWTLLKRRLATCYVLDVKDLSSQGAWPSTKTLRKNRWCERRLAEMGELEFSTIKGSDWNKDILATLAAIESASWVGSKAESRDTKFLDAHNMNLWSKAIQDPELAAMLRCSLLHVGGEPAAFTFGIEMGFIRHYIANSYSERFAERSAGRILLYRDFQQAIEAGIEKIGWGAGDPGYKSEMGAKPGPEIMDYLIVRSPLVAFLLRPIWQRRA